MAITSLDGIIGSLKTQINYYKQGNATVVGRFYSPFYNIGTPGAADSPTGGLAGVALTTYSGQIPFTNPTGTSSTYLARFSASANVAGTLVLCDRLWHNSGALVTSTGAQVINSVAFPARDINQTISGESVMIGLEVTTTVGAGTPTLSLGYVSSTGVQTTATTVAMIAAMPQGSFIPIPLTSGHTGVQSVKNFTQSATMTSGAYSLVAYRQIARVDVATGGLGNAVDSITSGFPKLFTNSVPFLLWLPATVTAPTISAQIIYAQG